VLSQYPILAHKDNAADNIRPCIAPVLSDSMCLVTEAHEVRVRVGHAARWLNLILGNEVIIFPVLLVVRIK